MSEPEPVPHPHSSPRWLTELVLLGAILSLAMALFHGLDSRYALDCDDTNLALAISRFDIIHFQPHPPGYLGYVLVLKLVHAITGLDPVSVTRLVSRAFALLAIVLIWRATLRLFPRDRSAALWAAALVGSHPILLYYGVDAQTHSAEMAMSALLLWVLAGDREGGSLARAAGIGVILAAGCSLRPSYALVAAGPVLWTFRRHPRVLALIAVVTVVGNLAWLLPTLALTQGGWATYRAATDSLMGNFVRLASPLSASSIPRFAHDNLLNGVVWSAIALAPALLACALWLGSWRSLLARWPTKILGLMAIPSVLFYCFVYCAEAGYLSGLVPPAALLAASVLSPQQGARRWQAWFRPGALVASLAFFLFAPSGQSTFAMLPTANEAMAREARMEVLYRHLMDGLAPTDRILVITDWPEPTALRQLPLLRPRSEILQLPWQLRSDFQPVYSIALATDHDFIGLFRVPGQPADFLRNRVALHGYDWIVVDPRTSDRVRDELRLHSRCEIRRYDEESQVRLRPDCFPDPVLRIGDFSFRFALAGPGARL